MKTLFLLFLLSLVFLSFCIIYRNGKVANFRKRLNEKCFYWSVAHYEKEDAYDWCYFKLPTYEQMLYSFRPLTEDEWLTPEMKEKFNN